jgi:hypothetical protein
MPRYVKNTVTSSSYSLSIPPEGDYFPGEFAPDNNTFSMKVDLKMQRRSVEKQKLFNIHFTK